MSSFCDFSTLQNSIKIKKSEAMNMRCNCNILLCYNCWNFLGVTKCYSYCIGGEVCFAFFCHHYLNIAFCIYSGFRWTIFQATENKVWQICKKLRNEERGQIHIPSTLCMCTCCLFQNGADDVKKHRWFKTIDWEAVPLRKLKVGLIRCIFHLFTYIHIRMVKNLVTFWTLESFSQFCVCTLLHQWFQMMQ